MKQQANSPALRARLRRLALTLGALLAGVLLLDRVVMPVYTRQHDLVTLPKVVGLPVEQARAILDSLEFPVSVEHQSMDAGPRVPADEVLEQFPRGNRQTKRGRMVHLTLSAGKSGFELPDLRGKSERQVLILLGDLGLVPDSSALSWRFNEAEQGTVLRQRPKAGRNIQRGARVSLEFSLGPRPETVDVPSLLGLDLEKARLALARAGLVLGAVEYEAQADRPAGIRGQSPLAGSSLAPEDSVSVRLNRPDQAAVEPDSSLVEE